ncbi:MAG: hypothetical protein HeimC3_01970 [Candidatus Heimdallarchaeota archaeon LC_3]|nr:MAG: hypothetical protein HeimC3_01970 [Candidatus Heimdallarchaeota archaeon LC_3]
MNKFSSPLRFGSTIHIIIELNFVTGKIIDLKNNNSEESFNNKIFATQSGELTIELIGEMVSNFGTRVILCDLNKMPRKLGFGVISEDNKK